jgi:ATPase subunit of ABC transporter with duplicated ATPase domains
VTEQQTFKIENVGGIVRAELILKPGMNVLAGRNGAGKTSAMRAIVRAQGGGGELERRDGAERGVVEGPGVKLTVGKVVRTTGQAELSLAEATPLANLIDPGLKDTEAAARARIRALIELIRVPVDDAALDALSQGDAGLREWLAQIV